MSHFAIEPQLIQLQNRIFYISKTKLVKYFLLHFGTSSFFTALPPQSYPLEYKRTPWNDLLQ